MPNRWTFQIAPIADLLARYVGDGKNWVDPFAGETSPAEFTNDLNPNAKAKSHLTALDFLRSLRGEYDGILFDPPYSLRQMKEVYDSVGIPMTGRELAFGEERELISNLIKPNGYAISFGWSSSGIGKQKGFEIVEILLVCHGGVHNDTIVVVEQKTQPNLF